MIKLLTSVRKLLKKDRAKLLLIAILIFASLSRLIRIDYPNKYIFDEVYHAYTAKEYLKGNKEAWSPWGKSEPGVAFEWLHPPIEKESITASMYVLRSTDAWAWRLPGALLGIFSIFLVYKVSLLLFKNEVTALISAFIFSIDGLVFAQSRIGMNDVYLVAFILVSVIFFIQKKYFFSALFMGVAIATKWPGIFLSLVYFPILIYQRQFKNCLFFVIIPPIIYLLSYTPYFLIGYKWSDFVELHRQIWWYQTSLKATHDYSSPWWSWPLNLYPVWYFVDYQGDKIANIFASGNPPLFWMGIPALAVTLWEAFKRKSINLFLIVMGFLAFFLPWAFSPRIMFLYHYSPSIPFLTLALGYQLGSRFYSKKKSTILLLLSIIVLGFILYYPFLTGIHIPKYLIKFFFLTNLTKNPF